MKFKKSMRRSISTIGGLLSILVVVGAMFGYLQYVVTRIDRLETKMEFSLKSIDESIRRMERTLRTTDELLNADLSWRYLYQGRHEWKGYHPGYSPPTRTLEFVKDSTGN